MSFSLEDIRNLLLKRKSVKRICITTGWHLYAPENRVFKKLSYDSRQVDADIIFL